MFGALRETALQDRPPVDLILDQYPLDLETHDPTAQIEALEARLETLFETVGILRCRKVAGRVPGFAEALLKTVYYRPSEMHLIEALADEHPVVLATTSETQRYVDGLVAHYSSPGVAGQLRIWKGASARFQLEAAGNVWPLRLGYDWHLASEILVDPAATGEDERKVLLGQFVHMRSGPYDVFRIRAGPGRLAVDCWGYIDPAGPTAFVVMDDLSTDGEAGVDEVKELISNALQERLAQQTDDLSIAVEKFHELMAMVPSLPAGTTVLVPDAHHFLTSDPASPFGAFASISIGALKDLYHRLSNSGSGTKVVLLCGDMSLPKDLREEVLQIDLPLPSRRELYVAIRSVLPDEVPDGFAVRLSEEAAGMARAEARSVVGRAYAASGPAAENDILEALRAAKRRQIGRSPALELVEAGAAADLGGMDRFERWLEVRHRAFSEPERAKAAGIDRSPRGVLLLGIPGSGKSLAAKVIARRWNLPLVRLDMGALRDKWVGSSEARVREALRVVEAMAPCVLWIDEIDKGIAQGDGHSAHSTDLNIRATLLTWMQENRHPVFIVATANRFGNLPPELTRAGRFDARFFFGCPGPGGRRRILDIHLRARGYDPEGFEIDRLVAATHGFTGAEMEQVVLDALYSSFGDDAQLSSSRLLDRASETQPLVRSAGKGMEELWELVENGRVELASDEMLTRAQVARLIDPQLFRPIYCRLERIEGFERLSTTARRFLMGRPFGGPAAVVMATGEAEWIYVQTNFHREQGDQAHFKFLDRIDAVEHNFVFDALVTDYGLETLLFETKELEQRFRSSSSLSAYQDMFQPI